MTKVSGQHGLGLTVLNSLKTNIPSANSAISIFYIDNISFILLNCELVVLFKVMVLQFY